MDSTKCIICGKDIPERRLRKGKTTCGRSCAQVLRFQDPEQKASFKQVMSNVMSNQETRTKISVSLKQPHHLERQRKVQRDLSNNKEVQEKKRKSLKKTWETKDREEHSIAIKQGQKEHNAIEKISASSLEHWQDEEYRNKVIAGDKAWWTEERRTKHSKTLATPEVQSKIIESKKQNGTLDLSMSEQYAQQCLEQAFSDTKCQYISEAYPFNCDFYIPSLDLYIELNFHWTHGGRPFNENDESCIEQLEHWQEKAKTSDFYRKAIGVWTRRDPYKKQFVIDNKLNWICFYSIGDFEEWLNKLI